MLLIQRHVKDRKSTLSKLPVLQKSRTTFRSTYASIIAEGQVRAVFMALNSAGRLHGSHGAGRLHGFPQMQVVLTAFFAQASSGLRLMPHKSSLGVSSMSRKASSGIRSMSHKPSPLRPAKRYPGASSPIVLQAPNSHYRPLAVLVLLRPPCVSSIFPVSARPAAHRPPHGASAPTLHQAPIESLTFLFRRSYYVS